MDTGAARRIRGRATVGRGAGGPSRGGAEGHRRGGRFLPALLLSLAVHALGLFAAWHIQQTPPEKLHDVELVNIATEELPGPAGGGGEALESERVEKPKEKPTPEDVVLEKKPVEARPKPVEPEPEQEAPEAPRVVEDTPAGPGVGPTGGGKEAQEGIQSPVAVAGGIPFPYAWYLQALQRRVDPEWRRRPTPIMGSRAIPKPVISFRIKRSGAIDGIRVEKSSGVATLDMSALGVITGLKRLQELPPGFPGDSLVVHYTFVTEKK